MSRPRSGQRALLALFPRLETRLPLAELASLPTPVVALDRLATHFGVAGGVYRKCDDRTAEAYGGNKVRTLEVLCGEALRQGASHLYATGAYGSNHAAAACVHAPRVGLAPGVVLYPQPHARAAAANLGIVLEACPRERIRDLPHWSALPWGMLTERRRALARGEAAYFMVPGGATALGALGYVSGGLELALQVQARELPPPRCVVVAAGSNCTTAGLLVGLVLAARLGIGFCTSAGAGAPRVVAVRVTPWPVTSVWRIVELAHGASRLLAGLASDERLVVSRRELRAQLELDGSELGGGYGMATPSGREAVALFEEHAGIELETTYSGKSAAALVKRLRGKTGGPILYWSTRTAKPERRALAIDTAPPRMRRWLSDAVCEGH